MNLEFDFTRESPFKPGLPVSPDYFTGRKNTITKILRNVGNVIQGNPQHFFLTGKKGMGKTSVAYFVKEYLNYSKNITGVYVSNRGIHSIDELSKKIIEALVNQLPENSRVEMVKKCFGDNIEIKGNRFIRIDNLSKSFKNHLPDIILDIYNEFSDKNGILIIIDDISCMSDRCEFTDWYKKLADTMAVNHYSLPVYFFLTAECGKFDEMVVHDESFGSIFHYDSIDILSEGEVREFFKNTFKEADIEISKDALDIMLEYSSLNPLRMQEIGDSVFWICKNNHITRDDALKGVDELLKKNIKTALT